MKKTIILSSMLLLASIAGFATNEPVADKPFKLTTLIVDANVTVVLVNNDKALAEIPGGSAISKFVTMKKSGDTLVIGATKKRDLKGAGVIYVSANQLKNIQINSSATVRSLHSLQIPRLDVTINGTCDFAISNVGELNLKGTKFYTYEQVTETRQIPASVLYRQ